MLEHRLGAVRRPPRVVIAGAGVGGLEAALALRALAGDTLHIDLVAPEAEFVYRALTVAEPFGYARALRLPLSRLAHTHSVTHVRERVDAVHPATREVELSSGDRLDYDALVVAIGARQENWLPGSVCFTGPGGVPRMREVLGQLADGTVQELAFAAPDAGWTLPLYELALLTAGWCAEQGIVGVRLSIVTPERAPLERFGRAAGQAVRGLLSDRGIRFVARARPQDAAELPADLLVTLPRLLRSPVAGLPAGADGFIGVDDFCAVRGAPHVYAVGDATDQPIKQGGLAAQQADVAAAAIAHGLGAAVEPKPFTPVLRGLLLGGIAPAFLRKDATGESAAAFDALWWPPTKVAGRHLGPYLADAHTVGEARALADRPAPEDTEAAARDRAELRRLALELARAEAGWGDYGTALHWLRTIEWLDGVLPAELAETRAAWEAARR